MIKSAPVVVLIHGTWARRAKWIDASSPLAEAIRLELGHQCTIEPFRWSGANSFSARRNAADALVTYLRTLSKSQPVALIAHSHGGSVVAYAQARDPHAFDGVRAIVCMATPFMGFSVRAGYADLTAGTLAALFFALLQLTIAFSTYFATRHLPIWGDTPLWVFVMCMGWLFLLSIPALWLYNHRALIYERFAAAVVQAEHLDTTKLLKRGAVFIRSTGDEIGLALSALQLFASISNRALNLVSSITHYLAKLGAHARSHPFVMCLLLVTACGVAVVSCVPVVGAMAFGNAPRYWIDLLIPWSSGMTFFEPAFGLADIAARVVFGATVLALSVFFLACLAFTLLALLATCLSVGIVAAFGKFSLTLALAVECAVEPTPEGAHTFFNAGWDRTAELLQRDRVGLRHSDPYAASTAIDWVVQHLRDRMPGT